MHIRIIFLLRNIQNIAGKYANCRKKSESQLDQRVCLTAESLVKKNMKLFL